MRIWAQPENAAIFLGVPFTIRVTVSDCSRRILWLSAQIAGKIRSLKASSRRALNSLVSDALGSSQNAPFFGHVQSGSRLIETDFDSPQSFCTTIVADEIPPSYDGEGVSITYELSFKALAAGLPVYSVSHPIRFVSDHRASYRLDKVQSRAAFSILSVRADAIPSPFACANTFAQRPQDEVSANEVESSNGLLALVSMPAEFRVGNDVSGLIDMRAAGAHNRGSVRSVVIQIRRSELYHATGANEQAVVAQEKVALETALAKRFAVALPIQLTADFSTDLFTVSHTAEFQFVGRRVEAKAVVPVRLFPPELTLSTQQVALKYD